MPAEVADASARAQTLQDCMNSLNLQPPREWAAGVEWTDKTTNNNEKYDDHAFCAHRIKFKGVLDIKGSDHRPVCVRRDDPAGARSRHFQGAERRELEGLGPGQRGRRRVGAPMGRVAASHGSGRPVAPPGS